jgi:hypothetical protein
MRGAGRNAAADGAGFLAGDAAGEEIDRAAAAGADGIGWMGAEEAPDGWAWTPLEGAKASTFCGLRDGAAEDGGNLIGAPA